MRVYVPTTLPGLRDVASTGEVGPPPVTAFAVTPALREAYAVGDQEELEYVALTAAAQACLPLIAAGDVPARRVVLAADVPDAAVHADPDDTTGAVRLTASVPLARVASVHVDDVEAEGHELLWYATQEIPDLIDG